MSCQVIAPPLRPIPAIPPPPPIPPSLAPRSSAGFAPSCSSWVYQETIPDTPFGGVPQPGPAPLASRTPIYSYWSAGNLTLTNTTLKFTPTTSTMSLAASRPCRRPPRATSRQLRAASHPLGPGPGVFGRSCRQLRCRTRANTGGV
jgi:hypothetical protein